MDHIWWSRGLRGKESPQAVRRMEGTGRNAAVSSWWLLTKGVSRRVSAWKSIRSRQMRDETRISWEGALSLAPGVEAFSPGLGFVAVDLLDPLGCGFWTLVLVMPLLPLHSWRSLEFVGSCCCPGLFQRPPESTWTWPRLSVWSQGVSLGELLHCPYRKPGDRGRRFHSAPGWLFLRSCLHS